MTDWIKERLLAEGMVSPDDLELLHLTDDGESAVDYVLECYERRCADNPHTAQKEDAQ